MTYDFDYCVVGLRCLDQLLGKAEPKHIGGAERQICTLARLLSQSGKSVAFISYGDSTDEQSVDGVRVFCTSVEDSGIRFVRFVYPHLLGLWRAMRRSNARTYIQMGAGAATGMVGLGTRVLWPLRPRRFIFLIASDTDTDMSRLEHRHERWLFRTGLKASKRILAQTKTQQASLIANLGYSSTIVSLPYISKFRRRDARPTKHEKISVLWVGRLVNIKRPQWVIELATLCPDIHFDLVGPTGDSELARNLTSQAASKQNVTLHGRVSERRLFELFGATFALCCTSEIEGFPTTFLEAWYFGVPIVTTFDPDNLVASNELGFVSSSVAGLAESLQNLVRERSKHYKASQNAYDFFTGRYSAESCAKNLLLALM